jgi:hypothetical protein
MQSALTVVVKRAGKEGLKVSPHKTTIVPFTKRRHAVGLGPLIPHGNEPKMLPEVKYLGGAFRLQTGTNICRK